MSSRKPGDWDCRTCQHLNYRSRESCHFCGVPRFGAAEEDSVLSGCCGDRPAGHELVKPGDWYCICGIHNYAGRSNCFKCGAPKDDSSIVKSGSLDADKLRQKLGYCTAPSGWKSGDWICSRAGCNKHNFASRLECYGCSAPRSYGTGY